MRCKIAENLKALTALPVFGFEWSGCHYNGKYIERNLAKGAGYIPILNIVVGVLCIGVGITQTKKGLCGASRPALIARGIVTILGGGISLAVVDLAVTVGRIAFRKPHAVVA